MTSNARLRSNKAAPPSSSTSPGNNAPAPDMDPLVDELVMGIERLMVQNHNDILSNWAKLQMRDLEMSYQIDRQAVDLREAALANCFDGAREEFQEQTEARTVASEAVEKFTNEREGQFVEELRSAGDQYQGVTAEIMRECTAKFRAVGECWDALAWDRIDRQLGSISWAQARAIHQSNPTAGVADIWSSGLLNEHLSVEKEGWSRSQQNDLERLQSDIQGEADQIFQNLQAKLRKMTPEAILVKPWTEKLSEMLSSETSRLKAIEQEVYSSYEGEIASAMWQCLEDYHGYEAELQKILVRCMEERRRSLTQMRQLKLSLCRWRLDYQSTYLQSIISIKQEYKQRRSTNTILTTAKETAPRRFMMVRRLLRRLWQNGAVPDHEIHSFLIKVCDCACKSNPGNKFSQLYRQELEKYGALMLVPRAQDPKSVDLWLSAHSIHRGRREKKKTEENEDEDENEADMPSQRKLARRGTGWS